MKKPSKKKNNVVSIHGAPSRASSLFNSRLNKLTSEYAVLMETSALELVEVAGLDPKLEDYTQVLAEGGYDLKCVEIMGEKITKIMFIAKEGKLIKGFILTLDLVTGEKEKINLEEIMYAELQKSLTEARK